MIWVATMGSAAIIAVVHITQRSRCVFSILFEYGRKPQSKIASIFLASYCLTQPRRGLSDTSADHRGS